MAQENKIIQGRKMRVDTTVVETTIHYPTDSSLMGDGVKVLTRVMKRISAIAGGAGAKLRDRTRSVKLRILEIGRQLAARQARARRSCSRDTESCWMRPRE
jgi:IS5 family transposase